ncbi:MAG: sigma-70 family RNA polymerase sigma factor [Planctomycetaceae bacterium]
MEPAAHSGSDSVQVTQWVEEARVGSGAAIGQVLEFCRHYLLGVANSELGQDLQAKGGASDLVQETFLEAQRDFAQFRGTTHVEVLAWLRRILLNNLNNFHRRYAESEKRRLSRELSIDEEGPHAAAGRSLAADISSPSSFAVANERSAALDRALDRLPADYREVIVLRHEQALSFAEVGMQMNRTAEAARKLWTRAILCLRQELEGQIADGS